MRAFLDFRFLLALIAGTVIAIGLFLFMHQLIVNNQSANNAPPQLNLVNFVQVQKQPNVINKTRVHPPPPPPPKKPPPQTRIETKPTSQVPTQHLPVNIKLDANSMNGNGVYIGQTGPTVDVSGYAPLTPMVRFTPPYPPQAQLQGVTGTVNTCFTVEPDGTVANPHVKHASSPAARALLSQEALRAILHWKFFPKKVNGKPVAAPACQDIQFKMTQ
ncbi:MAG: energy transducer TonB [Acidimicrobiales bacterium]